MGDQAKRLVKAKMRKDETLVSMEKKNVQEEKSVCNRNIANKQKRGEYARN